MNAHPDELTTGPIDLTLELRLASGSAMEFHESDAERIREALRLLATPRLFAQPHLLLASQRSASLIPCRGTDVIFARTASPLPLEFPLDLPAGLFDIVERRHAWPDNEPITREDHDRQPHRRNSRLEIHTVGGWTVLLELAATFHGNKQDERQFFSHLPSMPTIPFRLEGGGLGLINTANIVCVSTQSRPELLPGVVLPIASSKWIQRADSTLRAGTSSH